jgi:hypothetical protein
MRRAARVDKPHAAIMAALRKAGCQVFSLAGMAGGCPDLLVYHGYTDRLLLVEVKTPGQGRLTKAQELFVARFPVVVVTSAEEAVRLIVEKGMGGR